MSIILKPTITTADDDDDEIMRVSSDIVRSSGIDSSSKLLNQSLLMCQFKAASAFQDLNRQAYSAPSDRIARFNTPTAAGLTMKKAGKIAKQYTTAGTKKAVKVVGYSLAATAFEASARIATKISFDATNSEQWHRLGGQR